MLVIPVGKGCLEVTPGFSSVGYFVLFEVVGDEPAKLLCDVLPQVLLGAFEGLCAVYFAAEGFREPSLACFLLHHVDDVVHHF